MCSIMLTTYIVAARQSSATDTVQQLWSCQAVSLVQVFADKTCYIFDVMVPDPDAKAAVIRAVQVLMESASIIKVMHGCAPSSAALKYKLDIGLTLVVDLEVGERSYCHT